MRLGPSHWHAGRAGASAGPTRRARPGRGGLEASSTSGLMPRVAVLSRRCQPSARGSVTCKQARFVTRPKSESRTRATGMRDSDKQRFKKKFVTLESQHNDSEGASAPLATEQSVTQRPRELATRTGPRPCHGGEFKLELQSPT